MSADHHASSAAQLGHLDGFTRPFRAFARHSWAGGVLLAVCAVIAIALANSPFSEAWSHLWHLPLTVGFAGKVVSHGLGHWINDGLMVLFFLLVGLELKREMVSGELSSLRRALLPIAGAVGGMVAPALIYAWLNHGREGAAGWGIPMATDIAFALGVMRLVAGPRVPAALYLFLTALAIADDLGAVLAIAFFYTEAINLRALCIAGAIFLLLIGLNRLRVTAGMPYAVLGMLLWMAVLSSGVHATIAGVLLACTIPIRGSEDRDSTLHRWEHMLHPWITFLIVPMFALANAGVQVSGNLAAALRAPVFWGVLAGLAIGKPVGITLLSFIVVRCRLASLPPGVGWGQIAAVAFLGGIGFTMSLFINELAFRGLPDDQAALLAAEAKLGIIVASVVAMVLGAVGLRVFGPRGGATPDAAS